MTQWIPLAVVLLYAGYYVLRRGREAWIEREETAQRRRLNRIMQASTPKAPGYPSRRIS